MDNVDIFLTSNASCLRTQDIAFLSKQLRSLPEEVQSRLSYIKLKNPIIALILSLFAGSLAIDRFYAGDIGIALLKLFTCGGLGILTIIDWFTIYDNILDKNMDIINKQIRTL